MVNDASPRPASSRWSIVAAYALAASATMVMQLAYAPITTVAAQRYGVSVGAIGWLAQISSLLYVVLALPTGIALDRWFRSSLAVGVLLTAIGGALRLVSDDFTWAFIGQFVSAAAQPLILNGVAKLSGNYLAEKDRPLGIALGTAALYAGQLLAIGLGTVFSTLDQIPLLIRIGTAYGIAAAIVLAICLRRPGDYRDTGPPPVGLASLREVWADGFLRTIAALMFIAVGTVMAYMTWLEALLEPAGVAPEASGVMLLAMIVAGIVGSVFIPAWVARKRKEYTVMLVSVAVAGVGGVVLSFAPGVATGLVVMTVLGMLQLSTLPIVLEMVERRSRRNAGTAAALVWMAANAGAVVICVAVQLLVEHPSMAFLVLAGASLLTVPLILRLRRHSLENA